MTITLTREEAQQVLDALDGMAKDGWLLHGPEGMDKTQTACLAAIETLCERLKHPQPVKVLPHEFVRTGDQQVLAALEWNLPVIEDFGDKEQLHEHHKAIETLRARLSAPEPEPVAWNCAADLADASICKSWCGNSNCISHIAPSKPESEYESQPEPEPVADKYLMEVECTKCGAKQDGVLTVTAPPQREWQGLTDEEMFDCLAQTDGEAKRLPLGFKWFAEAIEAKLKEKNGAT